MKRAIAPTTLVIVFATVFVLGILPRAQADEQAIERWPDIEDAPTLAYRAASDSPPQELFSLSRPLSPALSLKSVGRPSTGEVILTQPRR